EYLTHLRQDKEEARLLYQDLLISVTNFFREPEAWRALEELVIEPMIRAHPGDRPIRAWVPGCATGEEAYTVAMVLIESCTAAEKPFGVQVFASDIDAEALAKARSGSYPESIAADLTAGRLRQFFVKGPHSYAINKQLRESVVFAEQNVISDPPFSK